MMRQSMFFSPVSFIVQLITLAIAGIVTVYVASFFGHTKVILFYMILFGSIALIVSSVFGRCATLF